MYVYEECVYVYVEYGVCVCVVYGVFVFSEGAVETAMKDAFLTLCS